MIEALSKTTGKVTRIPDIVGPPTEFKSSRYGMPSFKGATYDDHLKAWREVVNDVELDLWKLGAIASSLVVTQGQNL
jgi:hypothetical protein